MSTNIHAAFDAAGGQATVARLLGVSRSTVNSWIKRGFPVPRCPAIESVTQGVVNRQLTRPRDWHIHWPELAYPVKGLRRQPSRKGVAGADKGVAS